MADPDGVGIGADLAIALAETERSDDALAVVERALEHRPGDERLIELRSELT